jgi:type VI protein secretion system component VasF
MLSPETSMTEAQWARRERLMRRVQWVCIAIVAVCAVVYFIGG